MKSVEKGCGQRNIISVRPATAGRGRTERETVGAGESAGVGVGAGAGAEPVASTSSPDLPLPQSPGRRARDRDLRRTPKDGHSASESNLNDSGVEEAFRIESKSRGDGSPVTMRRASPRRLSPSPTRTRAPSTAPVAAPAPCGSRGKFSRLEKSSKAGTHSTVKKSRSGGVEMTLMTPQESEASTLRQVRDIHNDMRASARVIKDSRTRLLELQKKGNLSEADVKELSDRHELLLREMERFDRLTRSVQRLVDLEVTAARRSAHEPPSPVRRFAADYLHQPAPSYEPARALHHEMKMTHPTVALGPAAHAPSHILSLGVDPARSKSEIDLTRKLSESYDMQEKLVADNADLEVKRYILYKELMTKDQNLETCRAQIKRLQAELKMLGKENEQLHERVTRNNPEGDAAAITHDLNNQLKEYDINQKQNQELDPKRALQLVSKIDSYHNSTTDFEKQLGGLEAEVHTVRVEMDAIKKAAEKTSREGAGGHACAGAGKGCLTQPAPYGIPIPPMSRACGVCPPCPSSCNPNAPPTPAEKEVARLTIQLRQTEESFKSKVTECAMLRAELMKKKEDLEKERCLHREAGHKLRELEMKYEGLQTHTNMMLGTKEEAFEMEVNVRALKQCYREAREEIDELRLLIKEQNEQIQDYRVKYMQAQQLVEEQRRQMDIMDMDNSRISEQINLEIQKVKLKFQEKLQELAPIPELLKATQMRLKDAQQSQALAEHNAEQLARELNCAREKVHLLLHNSVKAPEKEKDRVLDDKQLQMLQQRVGQLTETNTTLKQEIERLKANVIRMEETVLVNEKRLSEKMHECAQIGGELERTRDEAARAIQRAVDRVETVKKCMQTTIAELERQLAHARAQVRTAEKERQEIQARMNCQIKRLNENFEQAQLRIMGLTAQVSTLRRSASSTGEGDAEIDGGDCQCKSLFDKI